MVEPDTSDVFLNTSARLFAGFTFIGQFIDHDITLDTTPLDLQQADPDATVNFRTHATTSTRSTDAGRDEPQLLRSGRPGQAAGGRMSMVSWTCRVTATGGRSSRTGATTRT